MLFIILLFNFIPTIKYIWIITQIRNIYLFHKKKKKKKSTLKIKECIELKTRFIKSSFVWNSHKIVIFGNLVEAQVEYYFSFFEWITWQNIIGCTNKNWILLIKSPNNVIQEAHDPRDPFFSLVRYFRRERSPTNSGSPHIFIIIF